MSPSSLESQIAEHTDTQNPEVHEQESFGRLALSSSDFSALEDRVARTINVVKSERQARAAAALDGADSGKFIQGIQQTLLIEPQHDFPNGAKTLDCSQRQGKISRRGDRDCLARAQAGGHF